MRIINLYQETLGIVSDCCKNKRNEKKRDFEGNESHEK